MKRKRRALITAIVVLLAVVLSLVIGNHPPRIDALQAESARIFPLGSTQVTCTVSGQSAAVLDYEWQASGGEIEGDGAVVTWMAPASEGFYYISVNVTDGRGRQASGHIMMTVKDNQPPIINSLTAGDSWITPDGSLNVTCDAEDYDGHALTYEWAADAGHFEGSGPEVIWFAPHEPGIYDITVVISDDYGGFTTSTLPVSVALSQPPHIEALLVTATHKYLREQAYSERYEVGEGRTFSIQCIASHADGAALSYEWAWDAGEIAYDSDDRSLVKWTAPMVRDTFAVTVAVSDADGNMVQKSVILVVVSCSSFG